MGYRNRGGNSEYVTALNPSPQRRTEAADFIRESQGLGVRPIEEEARNPPQLLTPSDRARLSDMRSAVKILLEQNEKIMVAGLEDKKLNEIRRNTAMINDYVKVISALEKKMESTVPAQQLARRNVYPPYRYR